MASGSWICISFIRRVLFPEPFHCYSSMVVSLRMNLCLDNACIRSRLILSPGPGNFLEVTKLLPLLKDGNGDGPAFRKLQSAPILAGALLSICLEISLHLRFQTTASVERCPRYESPFPSPSSQLNLLRKASPSPSTPPLFTRS